MNTTRYKLLLAPLALLFGAAPALAAPHLGQAPEPRVAVNELTEWPALQMTDLVARTLVAKPVAAAAEDEDLAELEEEPELAEGSIALADLLASDPMTVADLIARVTQNPPPAAQPKPQLESKPRQGQALTVQVVIPPEVGAKPLAQTIKPTPKARSEAPRPAAKTATVGEGKEQILAVQDTAQGLKLTPEALSLPRVGSVAKIRVAASLTGVSLFVRDQSVVELQQASGELRARQKGVTELYAVAKGKMYIVPVTVADKESGDWDLKVPEALVSLEGVFQGSMQSALYPGLEQATTKANGGAGQEAPSLRDSVAETARAEVRQAQEANRYYHAHERLGYKAVTLQVVDDRSAPEAGKIYPVVGAQVHLVGTGFTGKTDATGHLTIRDVPEKARFLLMIDDAGGAVLPAVAELETRADQGVIRVKALRSFTMEALTSIAQVTPHAALGSYCAVVTDKRQEGKPVAGVAVQVDTSAEGPFYFNRYGFLDRTLNGTGDDGRFCLFNVTPGPVALTLFVDQAPVATLPVSVFAGRHFEDAVDLGTEANLTTRLAALPTAAEQLGHASVAGVYKEVDMIDLIPLGTESPMMQQSPGHVSTVEALLAHHGRLRTYAQAAEFEPVVYTYQAAEAEGVTPLLPRGFIEDMSIYAQVTHSPELGAVLAEYYAPDGAHAETVAMRLVDEHGNDVGDGWYFSDSPLTKAIFFNVPAGTYSLLIETKDGYWLGADTVVVYNEAVSYARLGAPLRYRP